MSIMTSEKLIAKLTKEGVKTSAFFNEIPENVWKKEVYSDGASWTVREIVIHIVETEESLPRLFKYIVEGGPGVAENFDLDEYNENALKQWAVSPIQDVLALFAERRKNTIAFVRQLSEEDLQKEGSHPFLGQAPISEMIRLFYLHVNLHSRDIRKIMA